MYVATHHKRRQTPCHKCRHTPPETLPSPTSDLFSHPSHQQQIRWCRTHRLRELSFLRKEGHQRVWTESKKGSSRANSCGSEGHQFRSCFKFVVFDVIVPRRVNRTMVTVASPAFVAASVMGC
nr:hypothetical protein CFP56_49582 [Quercus suber]